MQRFKHYRHGFCGLCETYIIACNEEGCDATSCNCAACDKCREDNPEFNRILNSLLSDSDPIFIADRIKARKLKNRPEFIDPIWEGQEYFPWMKKVSKELREKWHTFSYEEAESVYNSLH